MKQQVQLQQAANKRPQSGSNQQPSVQTTRYREVPPRFMQQQPLKNKQQKSRVDVEFTIWGEAGGAWDKVPLDDQKIHSWPIVKGQIDSTLEAGSAGTPNSTSGSVISSSSFSGVQGTTNSVNASISGSLHDAHSGAPSSNASPLQASQCSGSSMLDGYTLSQGNPQSNSNSQSAQSTPTDELGTISGHFNSPDIEPINSSTLWGVDGSIGNRPQGTNPPMNQNPLGAKSAISEPLNFQQAAISNSSQTNSFNEHLPPHQNMQSNLHRNDSVDRYMDSASGSTGHANGLGRNFGGCNGNNTYCNIVCSSGGHSSSSKLQQSNISETNGTCSSQNLSYGAQYNSPENRASSHINGNENNFCSNPSFSGWQGLNVSAASSSSGKGWNIPDSGSYSTLSSVGISNSSSEAGNSVSCHNSQNEVIENTYADLIGATGGSDYPQEESNGNNYQREMTSGWGMPPPRLGLLGGGESSLNSSTTGWGGSPPSGATNSGWGGGSRQSNATTDMTNNSGMSPPKPQNTWAQAAGKGLNSHPSSQNSSSGNTGIVSTGNGSQNESGNSAVNKIMVETHVSEVKAALLTDDWGKVGVSQDTAWDVPLSPDLSSKENSNSVWRAPANTGTEIWENSMNNHNKNTSSNVTSGNNQPWGHTPSTHIGGTWGEEEDTSNMWTGVPQNNSNSNNNNNNNNNTNMNTWDEVIKSSNINNSANNNAGNGNGNNMNNSNTNSAMWNAPSNPHNETKHWGSQSTSSWSGNGDNNGPDNGTSAWASTANKSRSIGTWSPVASAPKKDIQPSGWEEPSPPTNRRPLSNFDDGTAVWGNPMRQGKVSHWKDMPAAKSGNNNCGNGGGGNNAQPNGPVGNGSPGMPPPGPGMIRLPSGATANSKPDMGNSMWGKAPPPLSRGTSWTDMPPHRDSPGLGNWEDPHTSQIKSVPSTPGTPGSVFGGSGWGEPTSPMAAYWGAKPKGPNSWADGQIDTSSWGGPAKQGGKPLTRDLIWASKQFRLLADMNFKKEDIENSLRNNNMSLEDALVELQSIAVREANPVEIDGFGGRKIRPGSAADELGLAEHNLDPSFGQGAFQGFQGPQILTPGFAGAQGFKPQVKGSGVNSNTPSLLNTVTLGGHASSLGSISSLSPALVQKIIQQQQTAPFTPNNMPQNPLGSQAGRLAQQNFPSAAQLRHLVQQIQMAVHAGHLNPQILNQPLAPQTLQLLYQLLQQIKMLHQLQQQQIIQSQSISKGNPVGPNSPSPLQLNVQITQTKQRIVNLQNQIAAQQALFLKQQQMQHQAVQHPSLHSLQPSSAELFKPNLEAMPNLHTEFRDLSMKESSPHAQSRLNQWKLPSYDKDDVSTVNNPPGTQTNNNGATTDFSRAPGSLSKLSVSTSTTISSPSNLHPLLSQGDSAWSSLSRSQSDSGGWPEAATTTAGTTDISSSNTNSTGTAISVAPLPVTNSNSNPVVTSENKESSPSHSASSGPSTTSSSHSTYNLSDLVPEFEPGKPWKGSTQLKNVEDDPHITPGSVARSPLSLNTIKDTDLFSWSSKTSPATTSGNDSLASSLASLTSSTWVFTPPTPAVHNSCIGAKSGNKPGWGPLNAESVPSSDLWGTPVSKARGPPPGLANQGKNISGSWGGGSSQSSRHSWGTSDNRSGVSSGWDRQMNSSFLVLRNLTPQIDGSTLKTLCMQHGPLQLFHLFLNHGIALVRYSTREEAAKAQSALNNCVLGNTTILADIPSEAEVQQYLQLAGGQLAGATIGWPTPPQANNNVTPAFRSGNASFPFGSSGATTSASKLDSNAWNGTALNMPGSHLWSFPSAGSSLWGASGSLNDHDQNTPSSLNSFLPGDLLGGESM